MAIPGTVTVTGPIAPNTTGSTYPVTDAIYGLDGLRNVSSTTERNAIPSLRRRQGMIVGIPTGSTQSYWRLKSSPWDNTDSDWELFSLGNAITGLTLNLSGYKLSLDGTPYEADLGILASDLTVTNGIYYPTSITDPLLTSTTINGGTARFFLNTDPVSHFDVSGFLTGYTDTRVINTTSYSNGTLTIKQDQGASDINVTGFTSITGGSINGSTISITSSNAEPITISGLTNIYTSNGSITTNRNVVLSNNSRLTFGGGVGNKFGIDLKLEQGNSNTSNSNYSHSEGLSNIVGYYGYTPVDITDGIIVLDSKYGDVRGEFSSFITITNIVDEIIQSDYEINQLLYDIDSFETTINLTNTGLTIGNVSDFIISPTNQTNALGADIPSGSYSHVEGTNNYVYGYGSHAEGGSNIVKSTLSHAEGYNNTINSVASHAEGIANTLSGNYSHAEGTGTHTYGEYSHSEGSNTVSIGNNSHSEGNNSYSIGSGSHAEGYFGRSKGGESHAEGHQGSSIGFWSHSEGSETNSGFVGYYYVNIVNGLITLDPSYGSLEFSVNQLIIDDSEYTNQNGRIIVPMPGSYGFDLTSTLIQLDDTSINSAEGGYLYGYKNEYGNLYLIDDKASEYGGNYSHSEGRKTSTLGNYSHSEGAQTLTIGDYSHAEGSGTTTYGIASHSSGLATIAEHDYQTVIGTYNTSGETPSNTLFVIGNGDSEGRSDLLVATTDGLTLNGELYVSNQLTVNDKLIVNDNVTFNGTTVKITGLTVNDETDYLVSVTALGVIVKTPISGISSQEVTIVGGDNISVVGSYPDFTIEFTGTTGGGDFLPLSGGTLTDTLVGTTISATTISGGTYYNLPSTLYSGDATLLSNRVVDLSSYTLNFSSTTNPNTFVLSGGSIGIGTVSPIYKLDVNGDTRIQSGLTVGVSTSTTNTIELNPTSTGTTPYMHFFYKNAVDRRISFITDSTSLNVTNGFLFSSDGTISNAQQIIASDVLAKNNIDVQGGILKVIGTGDNYIRMYQRGVADRGVIGFSGGSGDLQIRVNGATNLSSGTLSTTFFSNGNVGIGVSSNNNSYKLQVSGNTIIYSGLTANTITSDSLSEIVTGTTRLVEATSGGTLTATKTIVNSFILDPTAIAILEDISSWDINGQFVSSAVISNTYQGQSYYNSNYYFVAVDNNIWIRLIRG